MPVALATLATDEIDLGAQDDEGEADRDDAGHRHLGQDVAEIVERGEGGAGEAEEGDEADEREERRDVAHLAAQHSAAGARVPGSTLSRSVSDAFMPFDPRPHAASSRRSLLITSFANSRTTTPFFITRMRSASDSTVSGSVEATTMPSPRRAGRARSSPHPPWRRHPCRASARSRSAPSAGSSAISPSATFCWLPPESEPSSASTRGGLICSFSIWARAISRSRAGFRNSRADPVEHAHRDVLVERLVRERASSGGSPARRRCRRGAPPRCCAKRIRAGRPRETCRDRVQLAEQACAPARSGRSP